MKKTGRYDTSSLPEAQFEPGSRGRVLKNLLGIKRKRDMDEAESKALKIALDKLLGTYSKNHRFKEADIRKMHKVWLNGIYEWAGKYRRGLSKDYKSMEKIFRRIIEISLKAKKSDKKS